MEQDQKICPRCGGPAGDYRFCDPCRSHIDALLGIPPRDLALSSHPSHAAAEVLPHEQVASAEATGGGDRIGGDPSTTVEAPAEPGSAADADRSGGTLDVARLPGSGNERLSDVPHPRPDVARLEDVLTVDHRDRIAPRTAAAAAVAEPAHTAPEGTAAAAPADALERAKRELTRLEDALAAAAAKTAAIPMPVAEPASDTSEALTADLGAAPPPDAETPTSPRQAVAPSYLAAHALRAAFLYEQTTAFEQAASIVPDDEPYDDGAAPAPQVDVPELTAASVPPPEPSGSVPPPDPSGSVPPPDPSRSGIQDPKSPSVLRLWLAHASRTNWLAAFFLLGLIVMVVVLTGRAPRRLTGKRAG